MDVAAIYAHFAHGLRYEALPADVIEITKKLILDQIGVMVVGSSAAGVDTLAAAAREWGGKPEVTVFLHGTKLPAHHAALVNGTMARAFDFDALHEPSIVHATAGAVPQCFAIAERRGQVSGKELLTAMVAGMEFMIRLGLSFEESFLHTGRITSVHHTTFGGALAGAKLLDLTPAETVTALGLAYTQVGGNLQNVIEGTMMAQVQQGFAGQTGVLSATLAQAGLRGPERVFQGEYGYFKAYHDDRYSADVLTRGLGDEYEVSNISVKHYPCCFLTHYANDAMRELVASKRVSMADIESIDVRVTKGVNNLVCTPIEAKRHPTTTQEALFSLPYTVANTAVHGTVTLDHMTGEATQNPQVQALAQKVSVSVDEDLERERGKALGLSVVTVHLKNGTRVVERVDTVKGHPTKPMSFDDCEEKFWSCIRFSGRALDRSRLEQLVETVRHLERQDDVSRLLVTAFEGKDRSAPRPATGTATNAA